MPSDILRQDGFDRASNSRYSAPAVWRGQGVSKRTDALTPVPEQPRSSGKAYVIAISGEEDKVASSEEVGA